MYQNPCPMHQAKVVVKCPDREPLYFKPLENHTFTKAHTYIAHINYGSTIPGKNYKKIFHVNCVDKVFVSSELPALCGTKVVQHNNVLFKFITSPRQKFKLPTAYKPLPVKFSTNMALIPGQITYVCRGNLKFLIDRCINFIRKQV